MNNLLIIIIFVFITIIYSQYIFINKKNNSYEILQSNNPDKETFEDLINNKKIIKTNINSYINFYKKILKKNNNQYLENVIFIDYNDILTKKLSEYKLINHKIIKSKTHTTSKNKKEIKELLKKNYNFTLAKKIYEH